MIDPLCLLLPLTRDGRDAALAFVAASPRYVQKRGEGKSAAGWSSAVDDERSGWSVGPRHKA